MSTRIVRTPSRRRGTAGALCALLAALAVQACAPGPAATHREAVRIAVIGTNDVHGQLGPMANRGGLVTLSGYVAALRASDEVDAVLLVDAGDMWQGTLESNLDEGASVVDAYNAMGYAAAAIGNHEFDFGPVGPASVPGPDDDPRGALKARAAEAAFPLLAANLAAGRERPPGWPNVGSSVLLDLNGVDVGIVGIMTAGALSATLAANVGGLEVTPLPAAVETEARELRRRGADLVIVLAHAGGRCGDAAGPVDPGAAVALAACERTGEIFELAAGLPAGLVDHIVAGHVHHAFAETVNGISITSNDSRTPTFGRVDFAVSDGGPSRRLRLYEPTPPCPYRFVAGDTCAWADPGDGSVRTAAYAGHPVVPDPGVVAIAARAQAAAERQKSESLGVVLAAPFTLKGNPESALGNLVTHALLASFPADAAIHNVHGGLRSPLPAGELTYGSVYEMFPFDNRVAVVELDGRALREVLRAQVRKGRTRAGIAGIEVTAACRGDDMDLDLVLDSGRRIGDSDSVRIVVNDFLTSGGDDILDPAIPPGGFPAEEQLPGVRDALVAWFREQERLHPEDFGSAGAPRWRVDPACVTGAG
ncbi:MAG TPA: 5'-nucleotidase C-terminal domain-containing protein [Woeseiaceae bacterium]|nr:5'-nucleotidase C-terminal domain-containing protein [Woeseiaceae bacterium]